jgi:lipoate-protein ligase B
MGSVAGQALDVRRLGLVDYREAWRLQQALAEERRLGSISDTLLLLQHPHTYTIGRRGTRDHVFLGERQLAERGITCLEVDRGGDVTYHGPGQLVGYPIFKLGENADVGLYLRKLEGCLIDVLDDFGIESGRLEGFTGVWIGNEKIGAIGVKVASGVTTHGFALNVNTDLSYFGHILPCGIVDKGVTSMERQLATPIAMDRVEDRVEAHFRERFVLTGKALTAVA